MAMSKWYHFDTVTGDRRCSQRNYCPRMPGARLGPDSVSNMFDQVGIMRTEVFAASATLAECSN
jgi:hypothetical protein